MSTHRVVGRLAMRQEGSLWNAYYALEDSMDGALFLGSIAMAGVVDNPERKEAFINLMKGMVSDVFEGMMGERPEFGIERDAPESERGGNA